MRVSWSVLRFRRSSGGGGYGLVGFLSPLVALVVSAGLLLVLGWEEEVVVVVRFEEINEDIVLDFLDLGSGGQIPMALLGVG